MSSSAAKPAPAPVMPDARASRIKMYTSKTTLDLKLSTVQLRDNPPPKEYLPIPPQFAADLQGPQPPKPLRQRKQSQQQQKKLTALTPPPKSILLPFVKVDDEVANRYLSYVETDKWTRNNILRMLKRRKAEINIPGWLVQVSDARMNAMMDIQKALTTVTEREPLIATIHTIINNQMNLYFSKEEISEAINGVTDSTGVVSFSKFLFTLGNLKFAKKCGILKPWKRPECQSSAASATGDSGHVTGMECTPSESSKSKGKFKASTSSSSKKSQSQADSVTGYTEREKVFYSGLLVIQMSDTLHNVEKVYFQSYIPEPPQKTAKAQAERGFGIETIGVKNPRQAEWERVPPVPKGSPYLSATPFVTTRWKVTKPNRDEKGRRRTLNQLCPLHLTVQPPTPISIGDGVDFRGSIRITENRYRIKQVLEYLASKGDCAALLPGVHCMIHLSDTFVDKLEEVSMKPIKSTTQIKRPPNIGDDISLIRKDAMELYTPHGLPKAVAKMKSNLKYTTALQLRKVVDMIHEQHWQYMKGMAKTFGHKCWLKMHVERINDGSTKNSFINTFLTYLPHAPQLPASNLDNALLM